MKNIMLFILLIASYASTAAVYQWTDEQGITHFSDEENKPDSAQKIDVELTPPSIKTLTQSRTLTASTASATTDEIPLAPIGISIRSPEDQQTLRSNTGEMSVSADLSATLNYGSKIRLLIDGVIYSEQIDNQFDISNIPVGSHKLQLQIINNLGKVIASSQLITVYLHRFKAN